MGMNLEELPTGEDAPQLVNAVVEVPVGSRNKPDIFWDKSGSGNSFVGNLCNSSVPSSLCK